VSFSDGFCGDPSSDTITVRHTIGTLVWGELRRRQEPDGGLRPTASVETRGLLSVLSVKPAEERLAAARAFAARLPDSPLAQALLGHEARAARQPEEALLALRRARRLAPEDPGIAFALAEATRDEADLDEAIDGYGTLLRVEAQPALGRLRARLEVQRDIQRDYARLSRDGLTVLTAQGALTAAQRDELLTSIDRALDEAARFTGTERRQRLTVVVYPSRSELMAVSCVRSWAGALFDGTLRVVAGPDGVDPLQVRHETLHAQLSPLAPGAPKWFHEGVAQSFAAERLPLGTWGTMVRSRVWVPFRSLDGSFQIFEASDAALAYAQSYAMVEFMRSEDSDRAIHTALEAFQHGADTPTALARACRRSEVTGEDLLHYLEGRLAR
jgi:tetratricopeptide (TPR) repeat protein